MIYPLASSSWGKEEIQAIQKTSAHIVSSSRDKTIKIWNHESGELIKTLNGHTRCVSCVTPIRSNGNKNGGLLVPTHTDIHQHQWITKPLTYILK